MFAILAEDKSDFLTIKELIWRICNDKSISIKGKGFGSGSELLKDGQRELKALMGLPKIKSVIICHDADSLDAEEKLSEIKAKIIKPVLAKSDIVTPVVPISMIESWILADINACRKLFTSLPLQKENANPENCRQPKAEIERICRDGAKPRYSNATHNHLIAPYLDLNKVYSRCPSFRVLKDAVEKAYKPVEK